ncbi:MAG: helix-turn-helix domain-containing protein [Gemmatimonadaceae bacterium]|nr:helix-turn-helix domain-containing protein [Gemmatimonadaceae bacterium]
MLLQHLSEQGLGKRAIAKQLGISPRTVHHWIATGQLTRVIEMPVPRTSAPRPQRLDPFKPPILERLETYPALTAERLFAECPRHAHAR